MDSAEISITSQPNGGTTYFDQTVSFISASTAPLTVRLQRLHGQQQLQRPGSEDGNVLGKSAECGGQQRRPGVLGREQWPVAGLQQQCGHNSFGIVLAAGPKRGCPPAQVKPVTAAKVVTVPRSPTQTYRVIYNFTGGVDGGQPTSGLVIDAAGNLYGTTTSGGGPSSGGTVFKLTLVRRAGPSAGCTVHRSEWLLSRRHSGPRGGWQALRHNRLRWHGPRKRQRSDFRPLSRRKHLANSL